jgi:hypothetical protein
MYWKMAEQQIFHDKLYKIYQKYRKKYKGNPDSKQVCCMWSTTNPPDDIEDSRQILEIEKTFDISIEDEDCYLLYDMDLDEAALKIAEMIKQQG